MLSARWVTLRARWVTLRARWVTLRARWVDAKSSLGDAKSSLGDAESSLGDAESSLGDAKSSLGARVGVYTMADVNNGLHGLEGDTSLVVRATMTEKFDRSLFVFEHSSKIRQVAKFVVQWFWFQQAVLLAIICSTALLCLEDPLAETPPPVMVALDYIFSSFFVCECALKVRERACVHTIHLTRRLIRGMRGSVATCCRNAAMMFSLSLSLSLSRETRY
jgi:hypothetical protein